MTYYELLTLFLLCEYSGERFEEYVPKKVDVFIKETFYE